MLGALPLRLRRRGRRPSWAPSRASTPAPLNRPPLSHARQITWEDGFNQVAPFDVLAELEDQKVPDYDGGVALSVGGLQATAEITG